MQANNPYEMFDFVGPLFFPDPIPLPSYAARIFSQRPDMELPIRGNRPCRDISTSTVLINGRGLHN